jgi:uncharacterized membrane protein
VNITVPKSPAALALILFLIELGVGLIFAIAGRMTGVDTHLAIFGAVRLYLAAVALAAWYAYSRKQAMTSSQASVTSLIYCAVNFVVLSAVFAIRGTNEPVRAVMIIIGALVVLTLQYFILWFVLHRVSAIALSNVRAQQKLPGM